MPNAARGEVEIKLAGRSFVMKPTFAALCEVEEKAGVGISGIAQKFSKAQAGIREVAALVYGGLIGGGTRSFTFEEIGDLVLEDGFHTYVPQAVQFLTYALAGGTMQEKKVEAPTGSTTSGTPSATQESSPTSSGS